jgi:hypothetical protein
MDLRTFDLSRDGLMGPTDNVDVHAARCEQDFYHNRHRHEERGGDNAFVTCKVVKELSLNYFTSKLIKHFDKQRNKIKWPGKRNQVIQQFAF